MQRVAPGVVYTLWRKRAFPEAYGLIRWGYTADHRPFAWPQGAPLSSPEHQLSGGGGGGPQTHTGVGVPGARVGVGTGTAGGS